MARFGARPGPPVVIKLRRGVSEGMVVSSAIQRLWSVIEDVVRMALSIADVMRRPRSPSARTMPSMSTPSHLQSIRVLREPSVYLLGRQVISDSELDRFLADHN